MSYKPKLLNTFLLLLAGLGVQLGRALPSPNQLEEIRPAAFFDPRAHLPTNNIANTTSSPQLQLTLVNSTTKWQTVDGKDAQQILVWINNTFPSVASDGSDSSGWITEPYTVWIESDAVTTVQAPTIQRLRPGDQARVQVGVTNKLNVIPGTLTNGTVTVKDPLGKVVFSNSTSLIAGIPEYKDTNSSLSTHQAPDWWDGAKLGIFVHWGVYSVPAWSPSGKQYAECTNNMYPGENFTYDDFIPQWNTDTFNASELLSTIAGSGSKYFVIVTKHHDGFALFDTKNSSNRNSLKYGPKRDLVAEIFAAAQKEYPELHRGTYYSLPEWYSPAYKPYGFISEPVHTIAPGLMSGSGWPGGYAPHAYFPNQTEGYLGYVEVDDYLTDIMKPHMETLMYDERYQTEVLWCDIGGATIYGDIAADWYNWAKNQSRAVTVNNRCGVPYSDYNTPEYETLSYTQPTPWESTEGADPFSFGYNRNTTPSGYQNASVIIPKFVDIVSKNGNYLLDIGPHANGTVVAEEVTLLRDLGTWLSHSGEAIYNSSYWGPTSEDANLRFTTQPDAFYITSLVQPGATLTTSMPIPILKGDKVTMLGGTGKPLDWSMNGGNLTISVDVEEVKKVQWAWTFKVAYAQA